VLCIILRGCWCDIVQNVYAPNEEGSDGAKGSSYEQMRIYMKLLMIMRLE